MSVSTAELVEGIRHLGLSGRPVCVHCSLRLFGHVDGGADVVVNAFTDEGATLLVPSFSWAFSTIPPDEDRPERNGTRYEFPDRPVAGEPLEPEGGELRIMNTLSVSGTQMNGRSTEQFGLFSATLVLTRR